METNTKGILNGKCNRSACLVEGATYYNHSTECYYCESCAKKINKANPEALEMFGHVLCTPYAKYVPTPELTSEGDNGVITIKAHWGTIFATVNRQFTKHTNDFVKRSNNYPILLEAAEKLIADFNHGVEVNGHASITPALLVSITALSNLINEQHERE